MANVGVCRYPPLDDLGTAGRFGRNRPFIRSVGVTALAAGTIAAQ